MRDRNKIKFGEKKEEENSTTKKEEKEGEKGGHRVYDIYKN